MMQSHLIFLLVTLAACGPGGAFFSGSGNKEKGKTDQQVQNAEHGDGTTAGPGRVGDAAPPDDPSKTLPSSEEPGQAANGAPDDPGCSSFREGGPKPDHPQTLLEHVRRLPQPVTLLCFLQSLPRPLSLAATSSEISAQPAVGKRSPRVFLAYGDLVLTIALEGDGKSLLEFGHFVSATRSVKGELHFPLQGELRDAEPYENILQPSLGATTCVSCHLNEEPAGEGYPAVAFRSAAFAPFETLEARLSFLKTELSYCVNKALPAGKDHERCSLIVALFQGDVQPYTFPEGMPNMLQSF